MTPLPKKEFPVGIFDSGVGGLTILREIMALLPDENFVYFSDNAHCPYGRKSRNEIKILSENIVKFLLKKNCKIIVVACNTATGLAIDHLREIFAVPFVGVEPAIKPAAAQTASGVIGVLATEGTYHGTHFIRTKDRHARNVRVISTVGTGLVELVEQGKIMTPETEKLLRKYLEPMLAAGADQLVLGCTHYPLLEKKIRKISGEKMTLLTSGKAVAERVKFLLNEQNLLAEKNDTGEISRQFFASGNPATLVKMLETLDILGEVRPVSF